MARSMPHFQLEAVAEIQPIVSGTESVSHYKIQLQVTCLQLHDISSEKTSKGPGGVPAALTYAPDSRARVSSHLVHRTIFEAAYNNSSGWKKSYNYSLPFGIGKKKHLNRRNTVTIRPLGYMSYTSKSWQLFLANSKLLRVWLVTNWFMSIPPSWQGSHLPVRNLTPYVWILYNNLLALGFPKTC